MIKFNDLVEKQKNKIMVQIANDLNEQIKYINIFRDWHTPGVIERESGNPTFIYLKNVFNTRNYPSQSWNMFTKELFVCKIIGSE